MRKSLYGGILALSIAGLIAKIIGAIYRIPLTNILGAEGIGAYQLIFPLYALLLMLSSGGMSTTVSGLLSAKGGDENARGRVVSSCLLWTAVASLAAALLCVLFAPLLERGQGAQGLRLGYYAIAPSILIVGFSNLLKGKFAADGNLTPTAVSQIFEQLVKLGAGLALAKYLLRYGLSYAVSGALVGTTLAEAASLLALGIYALFARTDNAPKTRGRIDAASLKEVGAYLMPVTMCGTVFPVVGFLDSLIIVVLLVGAGATQGAATARYGLLTGPVASLVNMPVVLTLSLAVAIVPLMSKHMASMDVEAVKYKSSQSIRLSLLICVPCFFGMFILAKPIMTALYPALDPETSAIGTGLLRVASLEVILLSQLEIFNAMLQGMGRAKRVLLNTSVCGTLKIGLNFALIPVIGITGAAVASLVFYGTAWLLDYICYRRLVGRDVKLFENTGKILFCGVIMAVAVFAVQFLLHGVWIKLIVGTLTGVAVYAAALIVTRGLGIDEIKRALLRGGRKETL